MSAEQQADWESVDPLENDEVRTPDMFEESDDDPETSQAWLCIIEPGE